MRKLVIAIDGYSSTGKSSISKALADLLHLVHVDTGALYRAVTYYALQNFFDKKKGLDINKLNNNLDKITLQFKKEKEGLVLYLNSENVSREIRSSEVSSFVSVVAKQEKIRSHLLEMQKSWGKDGGIIMDGRDIGTVVFPDADFKFFLTASIAERTKRRFLELQNSGIPMDEVAVEKNLLERDKIDSERDYAPLRRAEDAIEIDNSLMTKQETIDKMYSIIIKK